MMSTIRTHIVGHTFASRRISLYRAAVDAVQAQMLALGHNIRMVVSSSKAPVRHLPDDSVDHIRYFPNTSGFRDPATGNPILKDLQRGIVWFQLERESGQPFSEASKEAAKVAKALLAQEVRARRVQFREGLIEIARIEAYRLLYRISRWRA